MACFLARRPSKKSKALGVDGFLNIVSDIAAAFPSYFACLIACTVAEDTVVRGTRWFLLLEEVVSLLPAV